MIPPMCLNDEVFQQVFHIQITFKQCCLLKIVVMHRVRKEILSLACLTLKVVKLCLARIEVCRIAVLFLELVEFP